MRKIMGRLYHRENRALVRGLGFFFVVGQRRHPAERAFGGVSGRVQATRDGA